MYCKKVTYGYDAYIGQWKAGAYILPDYQSRLLPGICRNSPTTETNGFFNFILLIKFFPVLGRALTHKGLESPDKMGLVIVATGMDQVMPAKIRLVTGQFKEMI
jgi:hypothetical protein